MTVSTRHLDRSLVGAALRAHDAYSRFFQAARMERRLGFRAYARAYLREARNYRERFEELLLAAEAGS